ncbi:MAG: MazG family protein [Clostridia bacterium]|nr:MazG family protein [Clostridia bacterium]
MNTKEQSAQIIKELLSKERYNFDDLCRVITVLRGEGGCPWDMEQNHHSIRTGMIEECYEVVEAIDRDDPVLLREELGDVLLQIVFHADIEKDTGRFSIDDVAHDECVKMIHRHPHVFGQVKADTSEQVLQNWEIIKSEEKQRVSLSDKLRAIPPMLPALMRASKVIKKSEYAAGEGAEQLIARINQQLLALSQENAADTDAAARMLGELLFDVTALCRACGVDAEEALTKKTERWIEDVSKKQA